MNAAGASHVLAVVALLAVPFAAGVARAEDTTSTAHDASDQTGLTPPRSANDHRMWHNQPEAVAFVYQPFTVVAARDFPPGAYDRGESGTTKLIVVIDSNGSVSRVDTQESSGFVDIDEAAHQIVHKWAFTPTLINGAPATLVAIPCAINWPTHSAAQKQAPN